MINIVPIVKILLSNKKYVKLVDRRNIYRLYSTITNWSNEINDFPGEIYKDTIKEIFHLATEGLTGKEIVISRLDAFLRPDLGEDTDEFLSFFKDDITEDDMIEYRLVIESELETAELLPQLSRAEELILLIKTTTGTAQKKYEREYTTLMHESSYKLKGLEKASSGMNSVIMEGSGLTELVSAAYEELHSTNTSLKTGIYKLDEMVDGFDSGTLTMVGAPSGKFKSGLLLNAALGFVLNNDKVLLSEPENVPFVQYISFENKPTLTFNRLAKLLLNLDKEQLVEMTKEDIISRLEHVLSTPKIRFKMDYFRSYSKTPEDLATMIEGNVSESGQKMECIALVVDYLFLLQVDTGDYRLSLSKNSRGLADLAIDNAIPVLSAVQLNAESELAERLTKNTVGESKAIFDHIDDGILFRLDSFTPLIRPSNNPLFTNESIKKFKYLECYHIKSRSSEDLDSSRQIIPFDFNNSFKLAESFESSILSLIPEDTIHNSLDVKYGIKKQGGKSKIEEERDGYDEGAVVGTNPLTANNEPNPYEDE